MAYVNRSYFQKLKDAWSPKQQQDPTLRGKSLSIDSAPQKSPDQAEHQVSGGNAFQAIAEAHKNIDQSQFVQGKQQEISDGLDQTKNQVNEKFNEFKQENSTAHGLDDNQLENLISDQDQAKKQFEALQKQNQNTFKDEVQEDLYDDRIKNLNQSTDQFLNPAASQGSRALDAYLLNQSGALNKARNELIQKANASKSDIKGIRDSSQSVVDQYEANRKQELERVKKALQGKMTSVDEQAQKDAIAKLTELNQANTSFQEQEKAKLSAFKEQKKQEILNQFQSLDAQIGKGNALPGDDLQATVADLVSQRDAKLKALDDAINAQMGKVSAKTSGFQGDKFYSADNVKRFNKISSLLGLGDSRSETIAPQLSQSSNVQDLIGEVGRNNFGLGINWKTLPKENPMDKVKDTIKESPLNPQKPLGPLQDNLLDRMKKLPASPKNLPSPVQPIINPTASIPKPDLKEVAQTVLSGGLNKVKKKFKW